MKKGIAASVFCATMLLGIGSAFADTTSTNHVQGPQTVHATATAGTVAPSDGVVEWPDWL